MGVTTDNVIAVYKKVLFGNQKQANIINDSVAHIVAEEMSNIATTVDEAVEEITRYIQETIFNPACNTGKRRVVMELLIGRDGNNAISDNVVSPTLRVDQPNAESPKHTFRVSMEGQTAEMIAKDVISYAVEELDDKQMEVIQQSVVARNQLANLSKTENFMERAERIKAAILPIISDGVRAEIPDNEWAQALCCAEYYYDFNKDLVKPANQKAVTNEGTFGGQAYEYTANAKKVPTEGEIDRIVAMYEKGDSIGAISSALMRPTEQIKYILRSRGYGKLN